MASPGSPGPTRFAHAHDRRAGSGHRRLQEGCRPDAVARQSRPDGRGAPPEPGPPPAFRRRAEARGTRPSLIDLERALQELHRSGVGFIVIGGVAATIHGSARVTQDLDIVYARTPENFARLAAALAPHAPYLRGA